jgi:NAD(P)-dependent dehydrogenase (short-subunit alcohol dehydrogenase family)
MEITGAVALVTGANRGLGLAFAQGLLEAGAKKVYVGVRDPGSFSHPDLIPVQLDVTDAEQVKAAAEQLTDVNLVINNAGVASIATPLSTDVEDARRQLDVNYLGILRVAQAFAPQLRHGALVNMLSVASFRPLLNLATYAASKAAAWSLTSSLREELEDTLVVAVHAGFIDTDMAQSVPADQKISPQQVVQTTIEALENDETEVLADEVSRAAKAALVSA